MVRWALKFAFVIIVVAAASWCWHLLTPPEWAYLTPEQIDKIENVGFGGVAVALMNVARKQLSLSDDK